MEQLHSRLFAMSRTHLHTRAQNAHTLSQCTSSQKEHQSIALSCTSFCYRVQPLSHTKRIRWGNYNTLILRRLFSKHQPPLKCHSFFSFFSFFYLRIKRFCKIARFILGWHDGGENKQLSQRHFPSLSQFVGKGGKRRAATLG